MALLPGRGRGDVRRPAGCLVPSMFRVARSIVATPSRPATPCRRPGWPWSAPWPASKAGRPCARGCSGSSSTRRGRGPGSTPARRPPASSPRPRTSRPPWTPRASGPSIRGAATGSRSRHRGRRPRSWRSTGEWVARLAEAVEELPPRQRAVILLRDVEGHTSQDVCQILDVTPTNQRVLLHRARRPCVPDWRSTSAPTTTRGHRTPRGATRDRPGLQRAGGAGHRLPRRRAGRCRDPRRSRSTSPAAPAARRTSSRSAPRSRARRRSAATGPPGSPTTYARGLIEAFRNSQPLNV